MARSAAIYQTTEEPPMSTLSDIFGPPIHTYTRAEAIADGVLIEATPSVLGRFPMPVAYTAAAHADTIAWDDETDARKLVFAGQDQTAREADVFWMFYLRCPR